ncbi:hypothetical protein LOK49_LG14G01397 [Camellia lanceoleosa]|uniref:Uncharacterized protein n=1 Tax=Camellia lanceoleosa TaxID=1840588 RepID=A0ACC0F9K2_9ERIC|nr:hypothetical protein LOK49_LG14G01397 [Camellia lanceoleosa]
MSQRSWKMRKLMLIYYGAKVDSSGLLIKLLVERKVIYGLKCSCMYFLQSCHREIKNVVFSSCTLD